MVEIRCSHCANHPDIVHCPICGGPHRLPVRPEQVRGATHGDFFAMSATIQALKDTMHVSHNWSMLHSGHKEALELIATKIGRILTGDPGHLDHWQDGAGYFNKGAEVCAAYQENKDA